MTKTPSDFGEIVARASFLDERLKTAAVQEGAGETDEEQIAARLDRWREVAGRGSAERFRRRLKWAGLHLATVRLALGGARRGEPEILPPWAETLRLIVATAGSFTRPGAVQKSATAGDNRLAARKRPPRQEGLPVRSCLDADRPLPFEEILLPCLMAARQKLLSHLGSPSLSPDSLPLALLSERAYLGLERSLLRQLVLLCAETLSFELSTRADGRRPAATRPGVMSEARRSAKGYHTFVQEQLRDGLLALFKKYPVMGRLVATAVDTWAEVTAEFLQRLEADRALLQSVFQHRAEEVSDRAATTTGSQVAGRKRSPGRRQPLGKVVSLETELSDRHHRGHSVIILTFAAGLKLVYKPKDVGLEAAFVRFVAWCNRHKPPLRLKTPRVVNRQAYGWIEFIERRPCRDTESVGRFYRRAGMLMCLMYVLGGTDGHAGNLVVSGEQLVLVDMETLLHPKVFPMSDEWDEGLFDSVLCTGLLPFYVCQQNTQHLFDMSGLGFGESNPLGRGRLKSADSDETRVGRESTRARLGGCVPTLDGRPVCPHDYARELVEGFRLMYRFLMSHREALLAPEGPLTPLNRQQTRFVFRTTRIYSEILKRSLAPAHLRDGVDWSIELERLSYAFLLSEEKPKVWPILEAELRAVHRLDIPYFAAGTDSDALNVGPQEHIEGCFQTPGYDGAVSLFRQLDDADLTRQVETIHGAIYASGARAHACECPPPPGAPSLQEAATDGERLRPLGREILVQEAWRIAEQIERRSIRGSRGELNWLGPTLVPNTERFRLYLLGHSLYEGRCGVALFLAALQHITGEAPFRNLILGTLQPLRRILQTPASESARWMARQLGIGGVAGLGSVIYSLVKIERFLSDAELLSGARRAVRLITPESVAADRRVGIMNGSAGTILGLLALYEEVADAQALERAIDCGRHLLRHRAVIAGSPRAWRGAGSARPQTGFCHGAAGIAYALLRLYDATSDAAYLEAAEEGIAYERSLFSEGAANWPTFNQNQEGGGEARFVASWCHGAAGIGLGRLGGLPILDTGEIRQEIEVALQTTRRAGTLGVDHLCCGSFGRIETLLLAAQRLRRPELREAAEREATAVVERARRTGAYRLQTGLTSPDTFFNPVFFQGAAGIGYELLRLAYPARLPAVLILE